MTELSPMAVGASRLAEAVELLPVRGVQATRRDVPAASLAAGGLGRDAGAFRAARRQAVDQRVVPGAAEAELGWREGLLQPRAGWISMLLLEWLRNQRIHPAAEGHTFAAASRLGLPKWMWWKPRLQLESMFQLAYVASTVLITAPDDSSTSLTGGVGGSAGPSPGAVLPDSMTAVPPTIVELAALQ